MPLTPEQRVLRAKAAAYARWSKESPVRIAEAGQAGLLARFEREVDPDGELPPAERARRAECARRSHMAKLALKSSKARMAKARKARKAGATDDPDAA